MMLDTMIIVPDNHHSLVRAVRNNPTLLMQGVFVSGWEYYIKLQVKETGYWHWYVNEYSVSA
jgi:hypothetical protein